MTQGHKALFVHFLTASGAIFAMLALLEAARGEWSVMFGWLVVALVVDGIDGPLARRYDVKVQAQRFDGVLLDLIIDFLTYVVIPAFALFESGLLPGWTGWLAILVITYASALYFADTRMKTNDNSFRGFPGAWNMVVLVLFAAKPPIWVIMLIIVALAVAMFLPVKFIHPMRTERWRPLTVSVTLLWVGFAAAAAATGFAMAPWATTVLVALSLYLGAAGCLQQLTEKSVL